MAATLPTQYAQVADLLARYDFRIANQASSDDNSGSQNLANQNAALQDASSEINTAILSGQRYTPTQIVALLATGDTMLIRMCCDIAYARLRSRRSGGATGGQKDNLEAVQKLLERLSNGDAILNATGAGSAGLPSVVTISSDQAANVEAMASSKFLGGPTATPTTSQPPSFGSAGYGASQSYGAGGYN